MTVVDEYAVSLLAPRLRSLGLNKRESGIVIQDVSRRLKSLLFHWSELTFRRTMLVLGAEEAAFWEPSTASIDVRALVAIAVRNSLIEDIHTDSPFTKLLRPVKKRLTHEKVPQLTSEAVKYFESAKLDEAQSESEGDLFADLPSRFPNAWEALSLLGNSIEREINWSLIPRKGDTLDLSGTGTVPKCQSGIDPRLDRNLSDFLKAIERKQIEVFFSLSLKHISRNPIKLLSIIDHVLRCGGTILTPNYLLSPTYLTHRDPFLRPAHYNHEGIAQIANPEGLSDRHREMLALVAQQV